MSGSTRGSVTLKLSALDRKVIVDALDKQSMRWRADLSPDNPAYHVRREAALEATTLAGLIAECTEDVPETILVLDPEQQTILAAAMSGTITGMRDAAWNAESHKAAAEVVKGWRDGVAYREQLLARLFLSASQPVVVPDPTAPPYPG